MSLPWCKLKLWFNHHPAHISSQSLDWSISSAASSPVDRRNSHVLRFHTLAFPFAYASRRSFPPTKARRSGARDAGMRYSLKWVSSAFKS